MPPEEFCRGTKPRKAANCRPDLNTLGSGTLAESAGNGEDTDPGDGLQPLTGRVRPVPGDELALEGTDLECQAFELGRKRKQCRTGELRQAEILSVAKP